MTHSENSNTVKSMSIGYVAIKTKAREYLIFVETMWLQIKKQKIA